MTSITQTHIWNFWKSNPKFWIPISDADKAAADKEIFTSFYNYSALYDENHVGQIIYLDQFYRHFQRILPEGTISEKDIHLNRQKASAVLQTAWATLRKSEDSEEILWSLMPLKHLGLWTRLFTALHEVQVPITGSLLKFYQDSYKKAFTEERIAEAIIEDHSDSLGKFCAEEICDYYPEGRQGQPGLEVDQNVLTLMKALSPLDRSVPYTISLSGGVDSMVMLAIMKHMGFNVNAIHIVYGNRTESDQEYAFIASFCNKLNVGLKVYRIEWLQRSKVEREFYEKMTRDIRFMVYRAVAQGPVLLGHIIDDVVENIWTNIANVQHLHNLKKMSFSEEQLGITLIRPFVEQKKEAIYAASRAISVPYLKNTTPSWSNRGKFREHFHPALEAQYGSEIDRKIIQFANTVGKQSRLLDRILYQPIYQSYNEYAKTIDITGAIDAQLDLMGWSAIFEHICHKKLAINKPSCRSIQTFVERLCRTKEFQIHMNKYLTVKISQCKLDNKYIMKFV
jgi:tRNA(Ile)-lysidine synthetase-like protein